MERHPEGIWILDLDPDPGSGIQDPKNRADSAHPAPGEGAAAAV